MYKYVIMYGNSNGNAGSAKVCGGLGTREGGVRRWVVVCSARAETIPARVVARPRLAPRVFLNPSIYLSTLGDGCNPPFLYDPRLPALKRRQKEGNARQLEPPYVRRHPSASAAPITQFAAPARIRTIAHESDSSWSSAPTMRDRATARASTLRTSVWGVSRKPFKRL